MAIALPDPDTVNLVARATAWQSPPAVNKELLQKWGDLFEAYDIGESGTISCNDFVKLEIRNGLEQGDLKRIVRAYPTMLRGDKSSDGRLDFMEFCKTRLSSFDEDTKGGVPSIQKLLTITERDLKSTMLERFRMGPHYSLEIRKELKDVFNVWKSTAAGLSPYDWLLANKVVETECDASLSEKWTGEAAFLVADANKDGIVQLEEFLNFSISIFQKIFGCKTQDALQVLRKVSSLETRHKGFSIQVPLHLAHPPYHFQMPNSSRFTSECAFWHTGDLELPISISSMADFLALLRLRLKLVGKSFSAFLQTSGQGEKSLDLLSSENSSQVLNNLFDSAAKGDQKPLKAAIYVKNIRLKAERLREVPAELQAFSLPQTAFRWCFDWEAHLMGFNGRMPAKLPVNFTIGMGDLIVFQLPNEESGITCKVFMSDDGVLSKPLLEHVAIVKGKRGKKIMQMVAAERGPDGEIAVKPPKAAKSSKSRPQSAAVRAVPTSRTPFERRFVLVGNREGVCTLFVEMSWEHQEEVLSQVSRLPATEASVGRVGPLRVTVERAPPKVSDLMQKAKGAMWWTGSKWSTKPIKRKGKSRPKSAK